MNEAVNVCVSVWFRAVWSCDSSGRVFVRDGLGGFVGGSGGADRTSLSETEHRSASRWVGADVAVYFLWQWFDLSDPAVKDAFYDSLAVHGLVGIDLGREPVPDETTMCKFRRLLERHELGRPMLAQVNRYLEKHGMKIGTGTIVDATILGAPSSTKNQSGERDTEMLRPRRTGNGSSA